MPNKVLEAKKNSGDPKKSKTSYSQRRTIFFFQPTNLTSLNLMGTYCNGICLGPSLLIFLFKRRGMSSGYPLIDLKANYKLLFTFFKSVYISLKQTFVASGLIVFNLVKVPQYTLKQLLIFSIIRGSVVTVT